MTQGQRKTSASHERQSMDLVQDHVEATTLSAKSLRNTLMVAPDLIADSNDAPMQEQIREFIEKLANSLSNRTHIMDINLKRAKQHRATGADAARRSCLEQAQAQWRWFTWILENQSTPHAANESPCPACRLRKPDQHQEKCRSCYDMDIMNAVVR